jgi:hypothetical protein
MHVRTGIYKISACRRFFFVAAVKYKTACNTIPFFQRLIIQRNLKNAETAFRQKKKHSGISSAKKKGGSNLQSLKVTENKNA